MQSDFRYAWKDVNGNICQFVIAKTKEELFEMSGFGAVNVDEPIKDCLAVAVVYTNYGWVEYGLKNYCEKDDFRSI